jgi:polyhydroxybutyrate depolymerase
MGQRTSLLEPPEGAASSLLPGADYRLPVDSREYLLHVPACYDESSSSAYPLLIAIHGGGGNPLGFQESVPFDACADRHDFFVLYPKGSGPLSDSLLTFNAGAGCCGYAAQHHIDDVQYIVQCVHDVHVRTHGCVDLCRVYATGHSNGGMMCYRLASHGAGLLAAMVPVAGAWAAPDELPDTVRPVPLLHVHSVDDSRALYTGGLGPPFPLTRKRMLHQSVEESVRRWAEVNGRDVTRPPAVVERRRSTWEGQTHTATLYRYEARSDRTTAHPVELWQLGGGVGHAYPGGTVIHKRLLRKICGPGTDVIDGVEEVWRFVSQFRRADP